MFYARVNAAVNVVAVADVVYYRGCSVENYRIFMLG